jgi:hypothetical protein
MERRYVVLDNETVIMAPNDNVEAKNQEIVVKEEPIVSASVAEGAELAPRFVEEKEM